MKERVEQDTLPLTPSRKREGGCVCIEHAHNPALLASIHASVFTNAWDEASFQSLLAGASAYAAFDADNSASGFIFARSAADEAEILTLAVRPEYQRQGIAGALLSELISQLTQAGMLSLFLEVAADNAPALALYHQYGFEQAGVRKNYYTQGKKQPIDALMLRKSLTEAVA